ncbi:MAG: glycosyltransferase [Alphaproteobacteria bacterium]|nr:glycosyltransferase [Alphaproteobacteria bacterium]
MKKVKILIPIYNDWDSLSKLLEEINSEANKIQEELSIIIINDCSSETKLIEVKNFDKINSVKIINMKENRGHGRCIATGLKYIYENEEFDYIIPMDGDGEDRPQEIKDFIQNINYTPEKTIVGERVKRSESLFFRFCYSAHKVLTYFFTGQSIKFGNFTCLTKLTVEKMINEKSTWSSFSGALAKVEKEKSMIPSTRGSRYFEPSKMSLINLVKHSLSIIAVFKAAVLIRSIFFLIIYFFLIFSNISIITIVPILFIVLMNFLTFKLSKRESLSDFNNALLNISDIKYLK